MNNDKAEWSVHLNMDDKGNVIYEPRHDRKHKKIIAANMTGKPFFHPRPRQRLGL
jgi:hypothetical protein